MIRRDNFDEYSEEEIEKWDTKQLMAHFKNIRAYRTNAAETVKNRQEMLTEAEWTVKLYDNYIIKLKDILSTREHIPNKQESKVIRQEKAKAKQNR